MRRQKEGSSRIAPGLLVIVGCLMCLGTGFFAGHMYCSQTSISAGNGGAASISSEQGTGGLFFGALFGSSKAVKGPVCLDTCPKAKDGICQDGRLRNGTADDNRTEREVLCDLGTDCDDCGPWTPSGPAPWTDGKTQGPVAKLLSREVKVLVKETSTEPKMHFAYTDPLKDVDVSYHASKAGVVEAGITKVFGMILKDRCSPVPTGGAAAPGSGLFVDVGANFGYFAVYAAAMGCRVVAFEPVPMFRAFLEFNVHLNGAAKRVDVRPYVVSHETGKSLKMVVPSHGIWGTAGIDGLNIDQAIKATHEDLEVPSVRLEDQITEDVVLLKVDVEGWEWSVMQGASRLITKHNVENIIMEYSPGVPERHFKTEQMVATVQMLVDMIGNGYRIGHIGDARKNGSPDVPFPAVEEVTADNLKYDMHDVKSFIEAQLGCPIQENLKRFPLWGMCNAIPEDISPRSFRSEIGHNTNIWASKNRTLLKLDGRVGIISPDAPKEQFFMNNNKGLGMGARPCMRLEAKVQVRHRCHCTLLTVCGEEEKEITAMAQAGRLTNNYVLP